LRAASKQCVLILYHISLVKYLRALVKPSVMASATIPQALRHPIPSIADNLASREPDFPLFSIPRGGAVEAGFIDISARRFVKAVDRVAWLIHDALGAGGSFETIAYIGPQDLRYAFVVLANAKVGYKVRHDPRHVRWTEPKRKVCMLCRSQLNHVRFCVQTLLLSPRNTLEGSLSLLSST
jgi:hypothetical protein